ncbi:Pc20g12790 [Penicillium rubens Wisconsin 54-1255]|uniref:Urease n=1 Tax=Penicillium rubens (strain ATCC 28089 / DSM 1075 / NRRL 1951 / Wisconsin 54-1255) TaxID=500485 RepID=B6HGM0_PENRW|nr:Pc20g12790 [Penicillium rubens Wisconsin 54-1255]
MQLIARELDKLVIAQTGLLAQRRLARGVKLNYSEATMMRDCKHTASELMSIGKHILGRRHVLPGVLATLTVLQIEGTFTTGTHLVTVDQPISSEDGNIELAMYGSFLPIPSESLFPSYPESEYEPLKMPGAISPGDGKIELNPGRKRTQLRVTNKGDRPIQVGSHFHFIESNPELDFDRIKAYGYHLDIPAGTSTRFEPGVTKTVNLTQISGLKTIKGGSSIATGTIDLSHTNAVLQRIKEEGFRHTPEEVLIDIQKIEPFKMDRLSYALIYGPTVGDSVRLGSTDLWVTIEKDYTAHGDECTFGGGKTLRDGIGQAAGRADDECADLVLVNALVIDWSGIFKADIGVKDGVIVGIGKAGNPDVMDEVNPALVIGSNTDIIAAEGKIITAGGIDTHVHYICPQQIEESISSGITTMFGGGTGPSTASVAANCTPSKTYIRQMMQTLDKLPVNFGVIGKGSDTGKPGLRDQCNAGVAGLKLHEDWGCTPSAIDTCLSVCEEHDIQCQIHSDSLNESGFVERTAAAFKGRTVHAYHIEGAGGGHAPDMISLVQHANVLPSSTNPTKPYTCNTVDEHLDMVMSCHHLSKNIPEDISFADSRIRAETIAAEDVLHDTGAISMMSSDSQAMGRCGEVVVRTWNLAHKNKVERGPLPEDEDTGADNHRVKRYVSKYTINPALAQGISHVVGSVEVGKLADLVIWEPASFGTKPFQVLKKGFIASAQMGDPNASISTVQPIIARPMFAPLLPSSSVMFVSKAGVESGSVNSYGLKKQIEIVRNTRTVTKLDMKFNNATPKMEVDPEAFTVMADGAHCRAEAATSLPLTHQYFIY